MKKMGKEKSELDILTMVVLYANYMDILKFLNLYRNNDDCLKDYRNINLVDYIIERAEFFSDILKVTIEELLRDNSEKIYNGMMEENKNE